MKGTYRDAKAIGDAGVKGVGSGVVKENGR